jgi:hypothetical protein
MNTLKIIDLHTLSGWTARCELFLNKDAKIYFSAYYRIKKYLENIKDYVAKYSFASEGLG